MYGSFQPTIRTITGDPVPENLFRSSSTGVPEATLLNNLQQLPRYVGRFLKIYKVCGANPGPQRAGPKCRRKAPNQGLCFPLFFKLQHGLSAGFPAWLHEIPDRWEFLPRPPGGAESRCPNSGLSYSYEDFGTHRGRASTFWICPGVWVRLFPIFPETYASNSPRDEEEFPALHPTGTFKNQSHLFG